MRTSQTATKTQLPRRTGEGFAPWGPVCLRKTQSTVCAERDQLPERERAGSRLPLDSRQDFEGPDNIRHLSSPQHLRVFAVFFNKKMQVPTKAYYNNSLCAPDSHAHWLLLSLYYYFLEGYCVPTQERKEDDDKRQKESSMEPSYSYLALSNKQELPVFLEKKNFFFQRQTSLNKHVLRGNKRGSRNEGGRGEGKPTGLGEEDGPVSHCPQQDPLGQGMSFSWSFLDHS